MRSRLEELDHLLAQQDLSGFSRRLLDLLADWELPAGLAKQAIGLRAAYNRLAATESSRRDPGQQEVLLVRAAELLTGVQAHAAVKAGGVQVAAGQHLAEALAAADLAGKPTVAKARGLTKRFAIPGHHFELPPLDLDLNLGEITGVVGENGNGKTTLLRLVAGELQADGGRLTFPWLGLPPDAWYQIKQRIAFIPQNLQSWRGTLRENLHFAAAVRGIIGQENEAAVDFVIHRMGLTRFEAAYWQEISSGYRLRFELARALVRQPDLLIIDEPLANLDINTQQTFLQDLRYLADAEKKPLAILLSSQHLHEVESIADRILFLKNGQALFNGRLQDFGQDREDNLFELKSPLAGPELIARLHHYDDLRVEPSGHHVILRTPRQLDSQAVMRRLVEAQVPVSYFRDISTSTLKLFRES
jgi:ABC-2 type transport system ATP-binding protein